MHYYRFDIKLWNLHTSHLTLEEEAIYFRLINFYYDTEKPIEQEKTQSVMRRLRVSNETVLNSILNEFFTLENGHWHHSKCDELLKEYAERVDINKQNGKKGGRPARINTEEKPSRLFLGTETKPNDNRNITLITNDKLLITNDELDKTTITPPEREKIPYQEIVEAYHEICLSLPTVAKMTEKRKARLRSAWLDDKRHQSVEFWRKVFSVVEKNDFLTGRTQSTERKWKSDFEWIINKNNLIKIIEGKYNNG